MARRKGKTQKRRLQKRVISGNEALWMFDNGGGSPSTVRFPGTEVSSGPSSQLPTAGKREEKNVVAVSGTGRG